MQIPFRYKLSLLISVIALIVVSLAFTAVKGEIEKEFRVVIEQRLRQAESVVQQRMIDRFERLFSEAVTGSERKLAQDILTDRTLSRVTSDDIVRTEILPTLAQADLMLVIDGEANLVADSSQTEEFWSLLQNDPGFERVASGEESTGLIVLGSQWLQWISMPVFIGGQLFGNVVLASKLGKQELDVISRLTGADILVIMDGHYQATAWGDHAGQDMETAAGKFTAISFLQLVSMAREGVFHGDQTSEVNLDGERYLCRSMQSDNPFLPEFVVAQSLDQALAFVNTIKQVMIIIALAGVFIASILGFVLAIGVSRPIRVLQKATRAVAVEDFSQRVNIRTRDEFSELGESFNRMSQSLEEKAKIRVALDKTVSHNVAEHLLSKDARLGGETREVSILFVDIRGFTPLSELLTEDRLLELLNAYFARINNCIEENHGVIDKFIGDAVMAVFGAPQDDADHALHALQAAESICKAVAQFNDEAADCFGCEIRIGVGINSGSVVAGMVGSEDRLNYTVLGNHVNIASRVESLTKLYGVQLLITEDTKRAVSADGEKCPFVFRLLDTVQVKGKSVGIKIYQPLLARPGVVARVDEYQRAYDLMLDQKFNRAVYLFENYLVRFPGDEAAKRMLERCKVYRNNPESYQQDYRKGVRILDSK
jgi:adenylate cyclase